MARPRNSSSPADFEAGWHRKSLRGRYKICEDEVLGMGGMATVYKGLDTKECKNVAVKIYSAEAGDDSNAAQFIHSVNVLQAITGDSLFNKERPCTPSRRGSFDPTNLDFTAYYTAMAERGEDDEMGPRASQDSAGVDLINESNFINLFDVRKCFVKLLDYSRNEDGEPGMDSDDDAMYLIFELGKESLHDVLQTASEKATTIKQTQLRDLQWTLVSIVWGLHAAGYVHLDIKPQNIMKFETEGTDQWKLIDLDGAVHSGSAMSLKQVTFTPEYMPPELAKALLEGKDPLVTSRLMDVWSVGMCAMEAIFLQPVLGPFYDKWQKETGNDLKYFDWLAKYDSEPIMSGDMKEYIGSMDMDMSELLEGMLAKNPSKRFCIGQCLAHKWFAPVRDEIMRSMVKEDSARPASSHGTNMKYSLSTKEARRRHSFGASKACALM